MQKKFCLFLDRLLHLLQMLNYLQKHVRKENCHVVALQEAPGGLEAIAPGLGSTGKFRSHCSKACLHIFVCCVCQFLGVPSTRHALTQVNLFAWTTAHLK